MPELTIRKGMKNDIDGIALLEKSCFSSPLSADMILKDMTENSMANYIVAELDGVLAGYIGFAERSEERRVGKECRSRWSPYH